MSSWGPSAIAGMGLEQVVAQMPAAVVVVEAPSGAIIHSNARAREMAERQLGRSIPPELTANWEIFHPDGRPYAMGEWPLMRSITWGEQVIDEEYFHVLPDGSRMIIRSSSSPVYDDDGSVVAGVLVMTDATEQVRQEERLTYLAGLLDTTEDAIVALDAGWFVTVWNKGAERMYGWTADEVVGRHTLDVARLEMSDEERARARRTAADHGGGRAEVVACRKDGTPVCVEVVTVALRGDDGEVTGYLGIHRDISERKRAGEALRKAQRQTETILDSVSDTFFAVDGEWRYIYVNEGSVAKTRRAWGRDVTAEELLGKSCWEVFPEQMGTIIDRELHRALRDQTVVDFEAFSRPTGTWVAIRAYPSGDGLSVFSRDISERKWAQAETNGRADQQALVADEVVELLGFTERQTEQERQHRDAIAGLTPRERQVLQALGDGLDSQQIADRMRISVRTARNHVAGILGKLGVHSQLQAVLVALRCGAIDLR
ncbi:MAG: domain S-box protein [Solirubrobacterales bacterium]|jgi:RNA polymerase sigma factor (sigma-70 family)|nr:domain S-box protein [Solirubrobacterales bacterium]